MRRLFVALISITLSSLVSAAESEIQDDLSCFGCSIVFLNIDLLRADFVGLNGSKNSVTPNIDAFFKNAVHFEDVSASSGVTAISNTSTLTARDGHFTYSLLKNTFVDLPPHMPAEFAGLYSSTPTIAEVLRNEGYKSLNFNHGWYAGRHMQLDRGFDQYWGTGEVNSSRNDPAGVIRKTADYIKETDNSSDKFFLLMRSEDLRGLPYRYPANRKRILDPRIVYREGFDSFVEVRYQIERNGNLREGYSSIELANWMSDPQLKEYELLGKAIYAQQLSFIDEELGKLFSELEKSKLLDNTIVVLYANHGDGLYDNKVPNHGVSYQSCVSVPLLIRHPKVKKKLTIATPVRLVDLVPTIFDFLAIPSRRDADGMSLLSVIRGAAHPSEFIFGVDRESQYVRHGNLKLIVWGDRTKELYDLKSDPREEVNIAAKYPQIVAVLDGQLSEHEMAQLAKAVTKLKSYQREREIRD